MDNRLQKRIAKNLLARVTVSFTEFFAFVQDLAKTGLGLCCNRDMKPGDEIKIQLNVPKMLTMKMNGKIAWKRVLPSLSKNKFQYGVFLDDRPEEYNVYVEDLLKKDYGRREHRRFNAVLEIGNDEVIDLLDAATEDISAAGLYVRTGRPLVIGAQYEMTLRGEGLYEPLNCLGEVVAVFECEPDNLDHPYGAGIRIISFVGGDTERFSAYLMNLEKLYKFHWPEELKVLIDS